MYSHNILNQASTQAIYAQFKGDFFSEIKLIYT